MTARSTALEQSRQDRDRLMASYRQQKKKQFEALFADPINGVRFKKFVETLNHFRAGHAERMVEYVRQQQHAWLQFASEDMRTAALEALGNRIVRIREQAGMAPYDDALPGEDDDFFHTIKKVIGL